MGQQPVRHKPLEPCAASVDVRWPPLVADSVVRDVSPLEAAAAQSVEDGTYRQSVLNRRAVGTGPITEDVGSHVEGDLRPGGEEVATIVDPDDRANVSSGQVAESAVSAPSNFSVAAFSCAFN